MLLPTINALRATWPESSISFLTLEGNREALAMTGAVDDIITIDTRRPYHFFRSWRQATTILRGKRFDLIIDFEQFARFSAIIAHQIGAEETIGFNTSGQQRHYLSTHAVTYDNEIHVTRSFYALATKSGVNLPFSTELWFPELEKQRTAGQDLLGSLGIRQEKPVVVMHIGTSDNFRERRWPPKCYATLTDLLTGKYGMHVILTGLPDETFLIQETWQQLKSDTHVTNLGGQLSFADYFSLIAASNLVISADTAAVHLASAVNTPVVGLYGPNSPHLYGPWGKSGLALYAEFDCSPCITNFNSKINTCRHPNGRGACMRGLTVGEVFTAIENTYCVPYAPFGLAKLGGHEI